MNFGNHDPDVEAVGFVVHADGTFEFANPCAVPLEVLETAIKKHKKKKPNKNGVTAVGFINLSFKVRSKKGKEGGNYNGD